MALSMLQRKPDSGLGNIRSSPADPSRNIDWVLLAAQLALTVAGCFIVFSATRTRTADPYTFVTRQVIFAIVASARHGRRDGGRLRVVEGPRPPALPRRPSPCCSCSPPTAATTATRCWRSTSARSRSSRPSSPSSSCCWRCAPTSATSAARRVSATRGSSGALIIVGIPAVLVIIQPDLGSGSVLIAMTMGVLLVAGAKARYIAAISVLSLATRRRRVRRPPRQPVPARAGARVLRRDTTPTSTGEVYQVTNAVRAVGTGGIFGKGWLQGPLTNGRDIPVIWADFPFAAVGEQFGLVGCAALLLVFAIVLVRIWRIASLSRDMFGTYLCAGVFTMLLWQVFQNVGMTMKIMPVTGLPMPFISYGGSSLITWFALLGLVQSVHMRRMRYGGSFGHRHAPSDSL